MSLWTHKEVGHTQEAKREVKKLFEGENVFESPKPERLMQRFIDIATNKDDIVLDFFAGSGTTAAVAHKMGRKFIITEQMDYIEDVTKERLKKVILGEQGGISKEVNWKGGGSFTYLELMPFNQTYIANIQDTKTKEELISIWNEMKEGASLSYLFDTDLFDERLDAFQTASIDDMKSYLVEILDKNQLYVNYSEIEDKNFKVSETDIKLNHQFYKKK
jgi:adenine-specific DNA-methyltransferase